jgi:hypothetical protein
MHLFLCELITTDGEQWPVYLTADSLVDAEHQATDLSVRVLMQLELPSSFDGEEFFADFGE